MEEIWKDIPGYEGRYQASSLGNIRSLDRWVDTIIKGTKCTQFHPGRLLRPGNNSRGYLFVHLSRKRHYVHRLVGITFIKRDDSRPFINHKDGNKSNNVVSNLEWCSASENMIHCNRVTKTRKSLKGRPMPQCNGKKVYMVKDGKLIRFFDSMMAASRFFGINPSQLSAHITGRRVLKRLQFSLSYENPLR